MLFFHCKISFWIVSISSFLAYIHEARAGFEAQGYLERRLQFFRLPKRLPREAKENVLLCGGNITVTSAGGKLTSPGYPHSYPSDLDCQWVLNAARDTNLVLNVISLNIERFSNCTYDYLDIYAGNSIEDPLLARICGNAMDYQLHVNATSALLSFITDSTFEERGFEITYGLEGSPHDTVDSLVCDQKLSGKAEGNVSSPGYPQSYLPNMNCITVIEVPVGELIYLNFQVLKLEFDEECSYDYVSIYDGPTEGYPKLGQFCSNPSGASVKSTNNTMLIHFHSDSILSEAGFLAQYSTQGFVGESGSVGACNWIRGENGGSLWSPDYPQKYPANSRCKIDLSAPEGFYISIAFQELQLEPEKNCSYDYINIRDGNNDKSPLLRTLCGTYQPNPVVNSTGNRMLFRFHSDAFTELKGFMAHYKFIEDLSKRKVQFDSGSSVHHPKLRGFILVSPNSTVLQGKRHALSCVPRSPTARIRWFKEHDFLGGNSMIKGLKLLGNTALEIASMEPQFVGRYTCVIVDDDNESTTNATIWISMAFDEKECDLIFRDVPYDVTITERIEYKLLECSSASPNVTIKWEKDGVPINDSRFQLLPKGHLYVDKLLPVDQGFYTCIATSGASGCQKTASAVVTVKRLLNVTEVCGLPKISHPGKAKPVLDSGRIVGGIKALEGAHPWQVMFWEPKRKTFCGGVLLNERWAISAAHCFAQGRHTEGINWPSVKMRLGKLDQSEIEPHEFNTEIEEILAHPSYNLQTFDNDLALIKLKEDVTFSEHILPICLGDAKVLEEKVFGVENRLGLVTGWGLLVEKGGVPRILRELQLPIVKQKTCIDSTKKLVTRNMFCAGYSQEIVGDSCKGDSGGPFVVQQDRRFYLVGLVSWGEGCAEEGRYGFYTKVSNYHSWIKGILDTA